MAAKLWICLFLSCSCSALNGQVDQAMLADIINNMGDDQFYVDNNYNNMADYPQYNPMDMYDDQPMDIRDMPVVNKIAPDPPKVPAKNSMLPAYCDPPNPCPHGYSGQDGCLEVFENTAEFSRQHQSKQECMCDTEHMFNCPDNTVNNMFKKQEEPDLSYLPGLSPFAGFPEVDNPYLEGTKLPVAAKKGMPGMVSF